MASVVPATHSDGAPRCDQDERNEDENIAPTEDSRSSRTAISGSRRAVPAWRALEGGPRAGRLRSHPSQQRHESLRLTAHRAAAHRHVVRSKGLCIRRTAPGSRRHLPDILMTPHAAVLLTRIVVPVLACAPCGRRGQSGNAAASCTIDVGARSAIPQGVTAPLLRRSSRPATRFAPLACPRGEEHGEHSGEDTLTTAPERAAGSAARRAWSPQRGRPRGQTRERRACGGCRAVRRPRARHHPRRRCAA